MILGCHLDLGDRDYGQGEIAAASQAVQDAAYAAGLDKAFRRSDPEAEAMSDEVIHRAFMVPWFIVDFVLQPERAARKPLYADAVAELDLSGVRAAADRLKAVIAQVQAIRDARRVDDHPHIDDLYLPEPAPEKFVGTLARHDDGRPRPLFHVSPGRFETCLPLTHFGSALAVSRHAENMILRAPCPEMFVYAAWLDARNPLDMQDGKEASSSWVMAQARDMGVINDAEWKRLAESGWKINGGEGGSVEADWARNALFADLLLEKGYDSIRYPNAIEGGGISWIVLDPSRVEIVRRDVFSLTENGFEPMVEEVEDHQIEFGFG